MKTEDKLKIAIDFIKSIETIKISYTEYDACNQLKNIKDRAWHVLADMAD